MGVGLRYYRWTEGGNWGTIEGSKVNGGEKE